MEKKETIHAKTTLGEVISLLGSISTAAKSPSVRYLKENVEVLAETEHCILYANGYALYDNGDNRTIFWVPSCLKFQYPFLDGPKKLPDGTLEKLMWYVAITLIGEHRIEGNSMNNRMGGRMGTKDFKTDDAGDHARDAEDAYEAFYRSAYIWREPYIGENPESIFIREETRREMLALMTVKQRIVFILYYRDILKQREIAEELGLSRSAVRDRLDGALKKVKIYNS